MSKKELFAHLLQQSGVGGLLRRFGSWNGLLVLNYHRVGDWASSPWDKDLFSASAEDFDAQMRFFKSEFDVIGAADLPDIQNRRGRYVQVTFDDGYRDNHDVAFPILKSHGLSATFFVCTGFLDHGGVPWWDELVWMIRRAPMDELRAFRGLPAMSFKHGGRLRVARILNDAYDTMSDAQRVGFLDELADITQTGRCPAEEGEHLWMTWDMAREMHRHGMTIGGHTLNHVELSRLPHAEQLSEIKGSCSRIEAELGVPVTIFSYPYGTQHSFDSNTRQVLAEAGVRYGYSYSGGFQKTGAWDDYNIKRIAIETSVSVALLKGMATLPQLLA